jgi:hypothetical protein
MVHIAKTAYYEARNVVLAAFYENDNIAPVHVEKC